MLQVLGIGTDIAECARIVDMLAKHGPQFEERVFTARELQYCRGFRHQHERFAGRWAAKEAVLKALGTGWSRGISWTDIEIHNLASGAPVVTLYDYARQVADDLGIQQVQISISHCASYAVAFAIALGIPPLPAILPGDSPLT